MTIPAIEGVVQNGQIRLLNNVTLPENTKVYVVAPDLASIGSARISSPRLAHPKRTGDFVKEVLDVHGCHC
jgi:hypothetical protein